MRPLRYAINVTLDGCCDHEAGVVSEDVHLYWTEAIANAGALLYGRRTYELMEFWRDVPEGDLPPWMVPFKHAIDPVRKYVVSSTLEQVDWNAELIRGDLADEVRRLKEQPGDGPICTGGLQLPLALAELGLIDEYEFVVQPRIVGRGPTLFAGLSEFVDLTLVDRHEFDSGAVALRYVPTT